MPLSPASPSSGSSSRPFSDDYQAPAAKRLKLTQPTIPVFRTSPGELELINRQVCRFVVATNSAFSVVDHPQFKKLCAMLRPGIRLANSHAVSGSLLDSIFNEEQDGLANIIKGSSATVLVDGWSTVSHDPIIGIALAVGRRCFLVATVDTTGALPLCFQFRMLMAGSLVFFIPQGIRTPVNIWQTCVSAQ